MVPTFLCPSYREERSNSPIDAPSTGALAYTTHYVGNAGPKGTNPATGTAYNVSTASQVQGGQAVDGILPYHTVVFTTNPTPPDSVKLTSITDGTSNTLMLFEVAWTGLEATPNPSLRAWQRGYTWNSDNTCSKNVTNAMNTVKYLGAGNYNDISMGSNHPGGCNAVMGDGSVRFLSRSIDLNRVLLPLASRNGGETLPSF